MSIDPQIGVFELYFELYEWNGDRSDCHAYWRTFEPNGTLDYILFFGRGGGSLSVDINYKLILYILCTELRSAF